MSESDLIREITESPTVTVIFKNEAGRRKRVKMSAYEAGRLWNDEKLLGSVWTSVRIIWGNVNARDWDSSM